MVLYPVLLPGVLPPVELYPVVLPAVVLPTNQVSVSLTQTVAVTAGQDQITGSTANDIVTITGIPESGDFFNGAGGSDTLNLSEGTMGIMNVESLILSGAGAKMVGLLLGSAPTTTTGVTLSAGADMIGEMAQNMTSILNISGLMTSADLITLDVDVPGGVGSTIADKVKFLTVGTQKVSLSGVDIVIGGAGAEAFTLNSSAGSNNFIVGGGGVDSYNLTNSAGADRFIYSAVSQAGSTGEQFTGFSRAQGDRLVFAREAAEVGFKGDANGDGVLDSTDMIVVDGPATAANDYWLFSTANGTLQYDADGSGAGGPVMIVASSADASIITLADMASIITFAASGTIDTNLIIGNTPTL